MSEKGSPRVITQVVLDGIRHIESDIHLCLRGHIQGFIQLLYNQQAINSNQKIFLQRFDNWHSKAKFLLDFILQDSCESKVKCFVRILKLKSPKVNILLGRGIKGILKGEVTVKKETVLDFNEIPNHLMNTYKRKKFNMIETVTGEKVDISWPENRLSIHLQLFGRVIYIENMVAEFQKDLWSKVIVIEGNAGCGKTVLVHKLVDTWMNLDECSLKAYKAVFVIPVKLVDVNSSLLDILQSERNGLKYLEESMTETLMSLITDESAAKKILFILDGCDDVTLPEQSEIFKLIKGEIYPHVKMIVTLHPGSPLSSKLNPNKMNRELGVRLQQQFHTNVSATTKEGVRKFLTDSHLQIQPSHGNPNNTRAITAMVSSLEPNMLGFSMLQEPLFLTMFNSVISTHLKMHSELDSFKIPRTATHLINRLMKVMICGWLHKLERNNEREQLDKITKNSDPCNIAPADIYQKLVSLGEISFNALKEQRFVFNKKHFDGHLIDIKDVKDSGLFSVIFSRDNESTFYYRNKLLQEYISALFLCSSKCSKQAFADFVMKPTNKKPVHDPIYSEPRAIFLLKWFEGYEYVVQFVFGLSPKLGGEILSLLKGTIKHVQCCSQCVYPGIAIYYEACLCYEAGNESVYKDMKSLLLQCESEQDYEFSGKFNRSSLALDNLCQSLTQSEHRLLLNKWYKMNINNYDDTWFIQKQTVVLTPHRREYLAPFALTAFNDTMYFLLQAFSIPLVEALFLWNSSILDINLFTNIFPDLCDLEIYEICGIQDEAINGTLKRYITYQFFSPGASKLKRLSVKSEDINSPILPASTVQSILGLTSLNTLHMQCDILKNYDPVKHQVLWSNLHTVDIVLYTYSEDKLSKCVKITHLLRYTPNLMSLTMGSGMWDLTIDVDATTQLLQQITNKNLKVLRLVDILDSETTIILCESLPNMKGLRTFGLGWQNIRQCKESILEMLVQCPHIRHLEVMYLERKNSKAGPNDTLIAMEGMRYKYDTTATMYVKKWELMYSV